MAWAALFGLPPAYVRFRALAHAVADEATAAFGSVVAAGMQLSMAMAQLAAHPLMRPLAGLSSPAWLAVCMAL